MDWRTDSGGGGGAIRRSRGSRCSMCVPTATPVSDTTDTPAHSPRFQSRYVGGFPVYTAVWELTTWIQEQQIRNNILVTVQSAYKLYFVQLLLISLYAFCNMPYLRLSGMHSDQLRFATPIILYSQSTVNLLVIQQDSRSLSFRDLVYYAIEFSAGS